MKMKNIVKSVRGGALAIVLSLVMVVSVFAGTGMEVRAEEEFSFQSIDSLNAGANDESTFKTFFNNYKHYDMFTNEDLSNLQTYLTNSNSIYTQQRVVFIWVSNEFAGAALYGFKDGGTKLYSGNPISSYSDFSSEVSVGYDYWVAKKTSTSSSTTSSTSSSPHTYSYSWVTVQEVTADQDGIEEYRCSCGDVQARSVLPAYMVFVKGLYGAIKDAPQNGTATFDSGRLCTISDYVIRKLSERPDVTTVITFEYQNQKYKMTIPAGVDYTSLLADEDYFYGYFYFANTVGAMIEAL